jgi:Rrf2 family nitric oxide-sensitive transcriptional repressor
METPVRLTTYTDYSLRVLMYLSVRHASGELSTIDGISRSYGISKSHLMKIVHQLALSGLLSTTRGRSGGVRLAREPGEISIGQVVRLCEPDFAVVECHEPGKEEVCALWQACNLKPAFRRAMDAFLLELDRMTLADAVVAPTVAASLLGFQLAPGQRIVPIKTVPSRAPHAAPPGAPATPPARRRPAAR